MLLSSLRRSTRAWEDASGPSIQVDSKRVEISQGRVRRPSCISFPAIGEPTSKKSPLPPPCSGKSWLPKSLFLGSSPHLSRALPLPSISALTPRIYHFVLLLGIPISVFFEVTKMRKGPIHILDNGALIWTAMSLQTAIECWLPLPLRVYVGCITPVSDAVFGR